MVCGSFPKTITDLARVGESHAHGVMLPTARRRPEYRQGVEVPTGLSDALDGDLGRERRRSIMRHVAPEPTPERVARACDGCGATLWLPRERVSDRCSYCDSRLVDASARAQIDRVCPFRVPRRAAIERLRSHVADAIWAPRDVRRLARSGQLRADELRGVLVPFFVYAASTSSKWRARIGLYWWRDEEVSVVRDGKRVTETRRVQQTEWFPLAGTAVGQWVDHLECASNGLGAREIAQLASFDLGRGVVFDPRVVSDFDAELPTRARDEVDARAEDSLRRLEARRIEREVLPGDEPRLDTLQCDVAIERAELALLPVWIAGYRYRGKVHRLLVHGQDGRCIGYPPISRVKVSLAAAALALLVVLVLGLAGVWS